MNLIGMRKKKSYFLYEKRKKLIEEILYVDLVIPETCWEQKFTEVELYHVDYIYYWK